MLVLSFFCKKIFLFFLKNSFFIFFSWNLYALTVFIQRSDPKDPRIITYSPAIHPLSTKQESPALYFNKITQEAFNTFNEKKEEVKKHFLALKLFNILTVEQIAELLIKENPKISLNYLSTLYKKVETSKIISFILMNNLSSKQVLFLLLPFLRENLLTDFKIIQILEAVKFDPNTLIKFKDIEFLLDSSSDSKNAFQSWKEDNFFVIKIETDLIYLPNKSFLSSELIITSLPHIATLNHRETLIKFFYAHPKFNPQIVNEVGQSPLHFIFRHQNSFPHKTTIKNWDSLFSIIFKNKNVDPNSKDIYGVVPMSYAIINEFEEALSYYLQNNRGIDLSVKDNYNRTLVHFLSKSNLKNKKIIIKFIIEQVGPGVIIPSKFNEYFDLEFNFALLKLNHPLQEIILTSFKELDRQIEEGLPMIEEKIVSSYKTFEYYMNELNSSIIAQEKNREELEEKQNFLPHIETIKLLKIAIKTNDLSLLQASLSYQYTINFINTVLFYLNEEGEKIPYDHLLQYAIEENTDPEIIRELMKYIKTPLILTPTPSQKNPKFYYLDPLSIALYYSEILKISSEGLSKEEHQLEMKKNQEIIDILMDYTNFSAKNFMNLTPVESILLLGRLDLVKKLKAKGIPIPKDSFLWNTHIPMAKIMEIQGYYNLLEELKPSSSSFCKTVFN
ncbi:MAG: hypothetical protein GDA46_04755 [Bdellovibrionales bacterium]|nr:hypothetical protein [Bdellovibrionales bacterium]